MGDIIRSVAVLGGAVAAAALIFSLVNDSEPRLPEPVEYRPALEAARAEYGYPVLAPEPVPGGWRATSVDVSQEGGGDQWRLGFLTDDEQFVGLEQSDGEIESFRTDRLADFTPDGQSTVRGETWDRFIENDDLADRALVRTADGAVTIVVGTVSYERLEEFTATLR